MLVPSFWYKVMAKVAPLLNAAQVGALKTIGRHNVGGGVYLDVRKHSRAWLVRIEIDGKRTWRTLGDAASMPLATARKLAENPHAALAAIAVPAPVKTMITFDDASKEFIKRKSPTWKDGGKSENQWTNSLKTYASPIIGSMPVDSVTVADVVKVLDACEHRLETRDRIRGRIENIVDAAMALHRAGTAFINPADRRFVSKIIHEKKVVEHHAAVPLIAMKDVFAALAAKRKANVGYAALSFAIVTAGRSGEVRGALWDEIDGDVWVIPAERMKAKKEHRVPLSSEALAILREREFMAGNRESLIFPAKAGKPLSDMAMLKATKRTAGGDYTSHGFRSTFRDWAAQAGVDHHTAELCLAHTSAFTKVESAYMRTDLLDQRRPVMQKWSDFLTT
jgi:integrase